VTTVSDDARAAALAILRDLLGIGPSVPALLELAEQVLGRERLASCLRLVRAGPLTRRGDNLAGVAALVVATRSLGDGWWPRVAIGLQELENRASAAVADQLWGPPVGDIDLNSLVTSDRIALPLGVRVGDRLVLWFDPGSRVDAVVVARADGALGSEIDLESCRHSPPAEVAWGWGIASRVGPHRLADEVAGTATDPYAAPLHPGFADAVRTWVGSFGVDVGRPWTCAGDVIAVLDTVHWAPWVRAAAALADGDLDQLATWLPNVR
jgi:hypothetical protein